jgi:hypothetical protein
VKIQAGRAFSEYQPAIWTDNVKIAAIIIATILASTTAVSSLDARLPRSEVGHPGSIRDNRQLLLVTVVDGGGSTLAGMALVPASVNRDN